jgi:hypothetical protein
MAQILGQALGGPAMEAFWYHFAILFEALFILTAVDAGTRVGRFMIQDMLGHVYRPLGDTQFLPANLLGTGLCVAAWGYFLYQGVVDPLGGINTLWQLFGVGNQMLAGIALLLCTSVLVKMKRERYIWVTLVPTAWLLVTTLTAGIQKIFHSDPRIGFLALANKFSDAAAQGTVLAPARSIAEMQRVAFNNYLDDRPVDNGFDERSVVCDDDVQISFDASWHGSADVIKDLHGAGAIGVHRVEAVLGRIECRLPPFRQPADHAEVGAVESAHAVKRHQGDVIEDRWGVVRMQHTIGSFQSKYHSVTDKTIRSP